MVIGLFARQGPETDFREYLGSDLHAKGASSHEGSAPRPHQPLSPATAASGTNSPAPTNAQLTQLNQFSLSQWGLEHASALLSADVQCVRTFDYLQNSILDKVRERNMQAFFVQKDILARHPKLPKWPAFVQQFIAGPMCGLIAMAELHKTMPGFDIESVNRIVDKLIWSTRLSSVGLDKARLIADVRSLRNSLGLCCFQLGMKSGQPYVDQFNELLAALHLQIIEASGRLLEVSIHHKNDLQHRYREFASQIENQYPCTTCDEFGQPQPYIWPAVWLTPTENLIEAAVQLRLDAEENARTAHPARQQAQQLLEDAASTGPQESASASAWPPQPVEVQRLSIRQRIRTLFSRIAIAPSDKPEEGSTTEMSCSFPLSIQSATPLPKPDKAFIIKMMKAFESSEGKRYFYMQKKDGTGWDRVKLTWSNGGTHKPASMFAVTTKDGAMLTMSRRHLSAMIAENALRELPADINRNYLL